MRLSLYSPGFGLPLLIEPEGDTSAAAAVKWLEKERELVKEKLVQHGAILVRGFAVKTPEAFEKVVRAIGADLKKDYLGTSPRNAVTEYVFNASELPPFYPIPQHCEMTFLANPPRRLFFSCMVAPTVKEPAGATPLCDFRKVFRDLDADVKKRFLDRGVRIIRNYGGPDGAGRFDLWQLKPWHEMFGTTDKNVVEAKSREAGLECTWLPGNRLRLCNSQPAFRAHPETGELVWFNHSQVFHLSAAEGEYQRIAKRMPQLRYRALRRVAQVGTLLKRLRNSSEEQAMHCTYGDGTEISDFDMECVREAIWKNLVVFPWQLGDVLMIDNSSVSHGRLPYSGPRHVIVCWE